MTPAPALPRGSLGAGPPSASGSAVRGFYGYRVVAYSGLALAATAPGQTAAVSAFIDPMITDLGLSRSVISTCYLVGTLVAAGCMPWVGLMVDRHGVRRSMVVTGAVFGAFLVGLSLASGMVGLTAGFVGIRLAGQGALGLCATTATALWFTRRRGVAVGVVSAVGAMGISLAPVALEGFIAYHDWRTAWIVEGLLVWTVVIPLALFGMRDRPQDLGQAPDGLVPAPEAGPPAASAWGVSRAAAVRTPFFWVVTAGVASSGMWATAVAFHQIDLLGEHGLSSGAAAGNFLPQTAAVLGATLVVGALADRLDPRRVTTFSMVLLAAGLLAGLVVAPGWSAIGFAVLIGAAGGAIHCLEAAVFPRVFGTAHLGSIRGLVHAISVGSTAFGPVAFALVHEHTDSYGPALVLAALGPIAVAVAALVVRVPDHQPG